MYKPQDKLNPEYPVFKKVNGRLISFLSLKGTIVICIALLIAVLFYVGAGKITYTETVPMDDLEKSESQNLYIAEWAALRLPELDKELAKYTDSSGAMKTDLTEDERQIYLELSAERSALSMKISAYGNETQETLAKAGVEDGLSADMLEGEAKALAPTTKEQQTPLISDMARFAIAFILVGLAIMLVVEPGGSRSLATCLLDMYEFGHKQHVYVFRRSCGTTYKH